MEPSHTRVLVEAAYAAGAGDRREAATTVLRLLEPVTHHDAGALVLAGVHWFAPFTAIAATMSVLALAISGPDLTDTADRILAAADWTQPHIWAALLLKMGASGLSFLPVVVASHLAYGMASRPSLILQPHFCAEFEQIINEARNNYDQDDLAA